jgi:hypothetical protein
LWRTRIKSNKYIHFFSILLVVIAFYVTWRVTADLEWPPEGDFFRDMGISQSFIEGTSAFDAAYQGELRWYNPLIPAAIAVVSSATGIPLYVAYAQTGPLINLLAVIGLYLLVTTLLGSRVAFVVLATYLFFGNHEQASGFSPTYSPWIWPFNSCQALAFFTLWAAYKAFLTRDVLLEIFAGILLGVTFLGHAAPAIVIALLVAAWVVWDMIEKRTAAKCMRPLLTIGAPAFLISLVIIAPLFMRYGLKVANPVPSSVSILCGSYVLTSLEKIPLLLGMLSLIVLASTKFFEMHTKQFRMLILLFFSSAVPLVYGVGASSLQHRFAVILPQIVPSFHFYLYFQISLYILAGLLVVSLAEKFVKLKFFVELIVSLCILYAVPSYTAQCDHVNYRAASKALQNQDGGMGLYYWVLNNTTHNDAFLADNDTSLYWIASANRKVVALDQAYSNPYVSYETRHADQVGMFDCLKRGNFTCFNQINNKYKVKYIVADSQADDENYRLSETSREKLKLVLINGRYRIYLAPD